MEIESKKSLPKLLLMEMLQRRKKQSDALLWRRGGLGCSVVEEEGMVPTSLPWKRRGAGGCGAWDLRDGVVGSAAVERNGEGRRGDPEKGAHGCAAEKEAGQRSGKARLERGHSGGARVAVEERMRRSGRIYCGKRLTWRRSRPAACAPRELGGGRSMEQRAADLSAEESRWRGDGGSGQRLWRGAVRRQGGEKAEEGRRLGCCKRPAWRRRSTGRSMAVHVRSADLPRWRPDLCAVEKSGAAPWRRRGHGCVNQRR